MRSSNGRAPHSPGGHHSPTSSEMPAAHAEAPPEGPPAAYVTADIELPAAYWDILSGRVKITLRG